MWRCSQPLGNKWTVMQFDFRHSMRLRWPLGNQQENKNLRKAVATEWRSESVYCRSVGVRTILQIRYVTATSKQVKTTWFYLRDHNPNISGIIFSLIRSNWSCCLGRSFHSFEKSYLVKDTKLSEKRFYIYYIIYNIYYIYKYKS